MTTAAIGDNAWSPITTRPKNRGIPRCIWSAGSHIFFSWLWGAVPGITKRDRGPDQPGGTGPPSRRMVAPPGYARAADHKAQPRADELAAGIRFGVGSSDPKPVGVQLNGRRNASSPDEVPMTPEATIQRRIHRALQTPGARATFCDQPSAFFAQLGWSWDARTAAVARDSYIDLLTASEAEALVAHLVSTGSWKQHPVDAVSPWDGGTMSAEHDLGSAYVDPLAQAASAADRSEPVIEAPTAVDPSRTQERPARRSSV